MRYRATPDFCYHYRQLPSEIQKLADRCYEILKQDSRYPSLHFKQVGQFRSVRVGLHYRALAVEEEGEIAWFWIGTHAEYDQLLRGG
ncbi:hypothetical protein I8751_12015 [Nostocaceae cyanobacterium CENA357]|uniref:ParE-like toxin domain-containing protein n=1 Tax=Atlanticothrix silvestris CENA357 TaxID=1725252 RepID=A0A8J7HD82_9CYAN|nr:hypothetical protein [Atlanticothrix silvestris]MBH8553079.1 hypothetical protein [Atlanticothrix silvestris CENA357]